MSEFVLTSEDITPERPRFDGWSAAARKKLGLGPEYEWCSLEALEPNHDTLIELGVPNHRGAWDKYKWRDVETRKCVITRAEFEDACHEYERATGRCHECAGTGEVFARWSASEGTSYRTCDRCTGHGRAPNGL